MRPPSDAELEPPGGAPYLDSIVDVAGYAAVLREFVR
jgi:hypothetical protein